MHVQVARVGDGALHYVDFGAGEPIVFVHGGLADYREFLPTMAPLSQRFRVIAYSRRHNAPNTNAPPTDGAFSAVAEAHDLARLLDALELDAAHVVGSSYGALTALFLALEHPERVQSLVLAEPPIYAWLPQLEGGAGLLESFLTTTRDEAAAACRRGDVDRSLDVALAFFAAPGVWAELPEGAQAELRSNAAEWCALVTSDNLFPAVSRDALSHLPTSVLMLSGGQTMREAQLIDAELERTLPHVERTILPDAGHVMCSEQPIRCADAIAAFLDRGP